MASLYRENQKFNQWWVWAIMLATMFFGIWAGVDAYRTSGDIWALLIGGGVSIGVAILFAIITLKTTINDEGIEVKFQPFYRRRIFKSEIDEAYVREYSALGEYGGWGIRKGPKGTAYNVSGKYGLQLKLKDGKSILIGTQNPEELEELMVDYLADPYDDVEELKLEDSRIKDKIRRSL